MVVEPYFSHTTVSACAVAALTTTAVPVAARSPSAARPALHLLPMSVSLPSSTMRVLGRDDALCSLFGRVWYGLGTETFNPRGCCRRSPRVAPAWHVAYRGRTIEGRGAGD